MHPRPTAPPRRTRNAALVVGCALLTALLLTGCGERRPIGSGSGPRLATMPVWLLVVVVVCIIGAGALLWTARHPLPSTEAPADDPTPEPAPEPAAVQQPSPRPTLPTDPRPPALTPKEFGIDTVLIAVAPAADPLAKMTRKSSLRHTRSRSRARPLPGGWPPPHPDWKEPG